MGKNKFWSNFLECDFDWKSNPKENVLKSNELVLGPDFHLINATLCFCSIQWLSSYQMHFIGFDGVMDMLNARCQRKHPLEQGQSLEKISNQISWDKAREKSFTIVLLRNLIKTNIFKSIYPFLPPTPQKKLFVFFKLWKRSFSFVERDFNWKTVRIFLPRFSLASKQNFIWYANQIFLLQEVKKAKLYCFWKWFIG